MGINCFQTNLRNTIVKKNYHKKLIYNRNLMLLAKVLQLFQDEMSINI